MKTLVIAEKPSAAKEYAHALGGNFTKHQGYMESDKYVISWAVGHLVEMCTPGEQIPSCDDKHWDKSNLPILPQEFKYKISARTKEQYYIIEKLIHRGDIELLINGGDSGREGEYIQRLIYDMAKSTLPEKRLWVNSMADAEIKRGFANLLDAKDKYNLYLSAKARAFSDFKIGINGTQGVCLYNNLFGYSVGRVQSVVVGIVAKRDEEIANFKPEPFYQISIDTDKGYSSLWFKEDDGEKINSFKDKAEAERIIQKVSNKNGTVMNAFTIRKTKDRPKLYNLAAIQGDAAKIYGYTLSETLGYVQSLYEKKIVSYPRTDSRYITPEIANTMSDLIQSIGVHSDIESGIKQATQAVLTKGLNLDKGVVDASKVTDHYAIIITDQFKNCHFSSLSTQEKNILDLIVKQMILALSPKYEYDETTIITEVENETFRVNGQSPISLGFMGIGQMMNLSMNATTKLLPPVNKGDTIHVDNTELLSKMTKTPEPITSEKLIKIMENVSRFIEDKQLKEVLKNKGIGTSATRGAIVDKVFEKGFLETGKGKNPPIHITEKGKLLMQLIPKKLTSPTLTAEWEVKLEQIANGTYSFDTFNQEMNEFTKAMLEEIKTIASTNTIQQQCTKISSANSQFEVIGTCPFCGSPIYENKKSFYCSNYKNGCKFSLWKDENWFKWKGKKVTKSMAKDFLAGKQVYLKDCKKKNGGTYNAYVSIKEWKQPYHEWNMEFK